MPAPSCRWRAQPAARRHPTSPYRAPRLTRAARASRLYRSAVKSSVVDESRAPNAMQITVGRDLRADEGDAVLLRTSQAACVRSAQAFGSAPRVRSLRRLDAFESCYIELRKRSMGDETCIAVSSRWATTHRLRCHRRVVRNAASNRVFGRRTHPREFVCKFRCESAESNRSNDLRDLAPRSCGRPNPLVR
jgi:hypothetical protein